MTGTFDRHFSARAKAMRASDVRELLKLLQAPDMISLAGGLPNPETFPAEIIRNIANDVLRDRADSSLQYGITEGYLPLREAVAERMRRKGMDVATDNVGIVSGSQQVIDLMGKVLIDPGDSIVVSAPTYLTALTGFAVYEARFEPVPIDEENMRMDLFEDKLKSLSRDSRRPKLVYALPNFQNPAGVTMPERNRRRLMDLASE
ncbi:MAG: PLP-dependent aminotransferase family protein, partial [Thermoplasmata archaeon]|nr:PLP-dependent aminotransferase family protein [Thermoplasmata archaeon]